MLILAAMIPAKAHAASIMEAIVAVFVGKDVEAQTFSPDHNLQTMPLLKAAMNSNPAPARGGGEILIVDDSAVVAAEGPAGTIYDIEKPKNGSISIYIVQQGDTLSEIADMFGVTPSTILWANDLPRNAKLQIGQKLTILPVTGVKYTVKKGDTLASIAKKYSGDANEIQSYNGLEGDLSAGMEIIIPNGEIQAPPAPKTSTGAVVRTSAPSGTATQIGYYIRPIIGGKRTQGIHGYNGVDLAGVPVGTAVMAAAAGEVIVSKQGGWNGGYGSYVVVQHENGSQTLYAHLSGVDVYSGQTVVQGQVIGGLGNTGKSTGAHLHFEIRNGIRNPF